MQPRRPVPRLVALSVLMALAALAAGCGSTPDATGVATGLVPTAVATTAPVAVAPTACLLPR